MVTVVSFAAGIALGLVFFGVMFQELSFAGLAGSIRRRKSAVPPANRRPLFAPLGAGGVIDPYHLDPGELAQSPLVRAAPLNRVGKRVFDIVASGSLLLFTLPLFVLIAVLVKLDSPGPVFYRQVRAGLGGTPFTMLKFRSMRADAEAAGPQWTTENDPRVTRFGRFLRKTRIDEIPQCLAVLEGAMSFVGPRPERPEFVEVLREEVPHFETRTLVKPGMTGWSQVNLTDAASVDSSRAKLSYDLFYIQNHSLLLDVVIVIKTLKVALLTRSGH